MSIHAELERVHFRRLIYGSVERQGASRSQKTRSTTIRLAEVRENLCHINETLSADELGANSCGKPEPDSGPPH